MSKLTEFGKGVDFFFNKVIPKKLLVVCIATTIVFKGIDAPEEYWWILMAYFGVNITGNIAKTIGAKLGEK